MNMTIMYKTVSQRASLTLVEAACQLKSLSSVFNAISSSANERVNGIRLLVKKKPSLQTR